MAVYCTNLFISSDTIVVFYSSCPLNKLWLSFIILDLSLYPISCLTTVLSFLTNPIWCIKYLEHQKQQPKSRTKEKQRKKTEYLTPFWISALWFVTKDTPRATLGSFVIPHKPGLPFPPSILVIRTNPSSPVHLLNAFGNKWKNSTKINIWILRNDMRKINSPFISPGITCYPIFVFFKKEIEVDKNTIVWRSVKNG